MLIGFILFCAIEINKLLLFANIYRENKIIQGQKTSCNTIVVGMVSTIIFSLNPDFHYCFSNKITTMYYVSFPHRITGKAIFTDI